MFSKLTDSINLKDGCKITQCLEDDTVFKRGIKGTRIIIRDTDTGKILSDTHNKVLITGAQFAACKLFGFDQAITLPTYNEEFGLENTLDYETVQPKNDPVICLFAVGQGGCGTNVSDVYPVRYTERIEPEDMIPFRYVAGGKDLHDDMRKQYFGRYTDENGMIRYMFKKFDTDPQLHLRYLDGTQITEDMYGVDSSQGAECYVEMKMSINRLDLRDYFEQVAGWDNAVINTISLLFAWYDDTIDEYRWYQQVLPFSKLNIPNEQFVDLSKSVSIQYCLYL